jgi:Zn-dependent peptidase ImmA (M78 family)
MPKVNPALLTWARETAGLSLEEAAHAIDLKDTKEGTGAERLAALERGEAEPPYGLLNRMSAKYRRSLIIFYLDKPPPLADRGEDFRTVPGAAPPALNATLDALIRDVRMRHATVRSILEDDEAVRLDYVGSARIGTPVAQTAASIVAATKFDLGAYRARGNRPGGFPYLRQQIEAAGTFVLLIGNLGSHQTSIPADVFRGFAIADPIAPFIVINEHDAPVARSFTALHELTHIWLGTTGVSGAVAGTRIERYCNDVAAEILMPTSETSALRQLGDVEFDEAVQLVNRLADERVVSPTMVAYRALRLRAITDTRWAELDSLFRRRWLDAKEKKREKTEGDDGGPSYYVVKQHRLGPALLNLVQRQLSAGGLSYTKAGQLLGVKPRNVEPLLSATAKKGGR